MPGSATPEAYWYMTYTVTNNGNREQRFYPEIDLVTDDGKVHHADRNIPQRAYDEIRGAERNPRLESFLTLNGPIRLGPAEAREGVAVWPETKLRMDHFQVYVGGLSGEAVTLKKGADGKLVKAATADLLARPGRAGHAPQDAPAELLHPRRRGLPRRGPGERRRRRLGHAMSRMK